MRPAIFVALLCATLSGAVGAQQVGSDRSAQIENALSAAPEALARHATVMTMAGETLRPGTSGWICFPDDPAVPNNSPMCLDAAWREVIDAWINKRKPKFKGVGVGYMLQGDMPVSNIDPFASGPRADNQWLAEGVPHLMIAVADTRLLEEMPTDPHSGGPWVMWKGTPYAHIMIPTVPRR